jgi:hypothetical protein
MSDFAATDLNSKAAWFGINKINQQLLLLAKPYNLPYNLTIKSYNFNNKGTVDLSPTLPRPCILTRR